MLNFNKILFLIYFNESSCSHTCWDTSDNYPPIFRFSLKQIAKAKLISLAFQCFYNPRRCLTGEVVPLLIPDSISVYHFTDNKYRLLHGL